MSANFRHLRSLVLAVLVSTVATAHAQIIIRGPGKVQVHAGGQVLLNGVNTYSNTAASSEPEPPLRSPRLYWKSGERADGQLISAEDTSLTWQAEAVVKGIRGPVFAEPLALQSTALARVEYPATVSSATTETFAITLVSGDRLYSDISAVSAQGLELRSTRHGSFTLPLERVQSIARIKDNGIIYSGPSALTGWSLMEPMRNGMAPVLMAGAGGTLVIGSWQRTARMNVQMPKKFELRLRISSTGAVRFGLGLTNALAPLLETWEDELVITWAGAFEPLKKLTTADRELSLRLAVDSEKAEATVYDWKGLHLGSLPLPGNLSYSSLSLKNKGRDLTLQHLSVRNWDGKPLKELPEAAAYAELMDGTTAAGSVTLEGGKLLLKSSAGGPAQTLELAALRSYQRGEPAIQQEGKSSRLRFSDGALITGDILKAEGNVITQKVAGLSQPLQSQMTGLLRITLEEGEWQNAQSPDRIYFSSDYTLAGKLSGSEEGKLQWLAPAANKSVALARGLQGWDIKRGLSSTAESTQAPALFFLKDGQVFPGELRGVDGTGVTLATPVADTTRVAHSDLNAVHFRSESSTAGPFGSTGWTRLSENVNHTTVRDGRLTLISEGRYGHASALGGDEVSFDLLMPESWGAVALTLFTEDITTGTAPATQIHFMQSANDMWCAVQGSDGNQRQSEQLRNTARGPISIRLLINENSIQINANQQPLLNASIEGSQRKGLGLVFGPSSMWGNGQARRVEVSNFQVNARPEYVPVPNVPSTAKEQVLTIPRFRKEQPPQHAILAPNGDVLRGRIESVSATGLKFQSGMETVDLPFSRLASAVWLRPASGTATAGKPAETLPFVASHWVVLQDGARLALTVDQVTPNEVKGWCPSLGDCRISLERISQIGTNELPNTAAMKAYENWQLVSATEPVLPESGGQSSPLLGKEAPRFAVRLLEGGTVTADSEKGKVLVLDFWATWCGPCVKSLPATLQVVQQFDPTQVRCIAVNQGETEDQVRRFLAARGLQMSVGMDVNQAMGKAFGAESIPHTVIIDRAGNVVWVNTGAGAETQLQSAIQEALKVN